ncbi:MAG: VanZ family protein [Candidatus Paceibacterota bacterium]
MSNWKLKIILKYWLPVLLWCAGIYCLSGIPSLRSELPGGWDYALRKISHLTEYAFLTFLFFRAATQSMDKRRAIAYATLFAFTFALSDEYHQSFVFGRSGNATDVAIDSLGIFLSVLLIDKRYLDASIKKRK